MATHSYFVNVLSPKCHCMAFLSFRLACVSGNSYFVQIVCYHKDVAKRSRETVFRVQFHTCTLHGHPLAFRKMDLDLANKGTNTGSEIMHFTKGKDKIVGCPTVRRAAKKNKKNKTMQDRRKRGRVCR